MWSAIFCGMDMYAPQPSLASFHVGISTSEHECWMLVLKLNECNDGKEKKGMKVRQY